MEPRVFYRNLGEPAATPMPAPEPASAIWIPAPAAPLAEPAERVETAIPPLTRTVLALGRTAVALGARSMQAQFDEAGTALVAMPALDRDAIELMLVSRADFAVVGAPLSVRDRHAGLQGTLLGVELFALAVRRDSPLCALRSDQVRQLLTGEVRDWRQLGLSPAPVVLAAPADRDVAARAARALIPGDPLFAGARRVDGDAGVFDLLLREPGAIGVVRAAAVARDPDVRLLPIDLVPPSVDAFVGGSYPFGVPLVLVTMGTPGGAAVQYLEWIRGADHTLPDWLSLAQ